MKLATLVLATISVVSVSAKPSWMPSQVKIQEDYPVPGDNPLFFCNDPKGDILEIKNVDLDPNPPQPGSTLTITATGNFKERVEKGAKIHLQVKYGLITLINQEADLCDTIKKADMSCPLEKGDMALTKDVDLPNEIPPGNYAVFADVYTEAGEKITCLESKITFSR